MKTYKTIAFMFLIFLIVTSYFAVEVSATSSLGQFRQRANVILKQGCATCTYNNITSVTVPGGIMALRGEFAMTRSGSEYNYTFTNTSRYGEYTVLGHGDINGIDTTWSYTFSVGNIWISLIIALFAIIFLIVALTMDQPFLGLFSGLFFIVLGIYSMAYGVIFLQDTYTSMFASIVIGIGFVVGFASIYEMYFVKDD